ncbi:MAG: hypothetical protein WAZ18_07245 [Alphaproteobacteria bacterium]
MGSIFSGPKIPAPPAPPPPSTVRDEVNGVEQVPVTQADGSITYVTRAIPLTAEQQAQKAELDGIMSTALGEIKKLSATDYTVDAETTRVLDQWQRVQDKLVKEGFAARATSEEEALARKGLGDSTAGLAVRRARALDAQDAEQKLALSRDSLAEQVRGERLGLQQNLYNLAASQKDATQAKTYEAAIRGQSNVAAINAQRNASLLDYYDRSVNRNAGMGGIFGNALASSLGGSLGRGVGGGPFGVVGGFLGSLFRK